VSVSWLARRPGLTAIMQGAVCVMDILATEARREICMSARALVERGATLTVEVTRQDDSFVIEPVLMNVEEFVQVGNVSCALRRAVPRRDQTKSERPIDVDTCE